jgi:hypothetical protein
MRRFIRVLEFKEVDIKDYLPDIVTSLLRLYNSEISFNGDLR